MNEVWSDSLQIEQQRNEAGLDLTLKVYIILLEVTATLLNRDLGALLLWKRRGGEPATPEGY